MANERIQQLHQLVEQDAGNPLFHYTLGLEYLKIKDAESALPFLQKAIQLNSNYSAAYRELGKALFQLGQLDKAAQIYQKGIEMAEQQGDIQTVKEMNVFLNRILKQKRGET